MKLKQRLIEGLYFLFTALIVIGPALYNRYPLVYFDSGAYMEMAAGLEPSFHRAIGYPLLMRLTGFLTSNWPVVVIQGLAVSVLLYQLLGIFVRQNVRWIHFLFICTLAFTSSLSWYAAQLMPDVFTFLMAISAAIIVLKPHINWKQTVLYAAILWVTLITHLSHIPVLLLIVCCLLARKFLAKKSMEKRRWAGLSGALIGAVLFTMIYNAAWGYGMRLSMASNVFITANIGEMGYLKLYLDENCDNDELALCDIKDNLPLETGGYLWEKGNPVELHPEGWQGMNEDCAPIVHDFLTKPRYLKWFVFGSIKATFKQMFQIELGSGLQYTYGDGSPPSWPMRTHFTQELNEYLTSVQNKDATQLPLQFFKYLNYISLFLALLVIGWAILTQKMDEKLFLLLMIFCAFYFFNAAVTGVLANVYERLQCRLLPLFPLFALLVLAVNQKLGPATADK